MSAPFLRWGISRNFGEAIAGNAINSIDIVFVQRCHKFLLALWRNLRLDDVNEKCCAIHRILDKLISLIG